MLKSRGWTWRQIDVQIDLIDAIVLVGQTKRLFPTKILKSKGPSFITRITPTSVQHTHTPTVSLRLGLSDDDGLSFRYLPLNRWPTSCCCHSIDVNRSMMNEIVFLVAQNIHESFLAWRITIKNPVIPGNLWYQPQTHNWWWRTIEKSFDFHYLKYGRLDRYLWSFPNTTRNVSKPLVTSFFQPFKKWIETFSNKKSAS